jgi:hypothetical protein
MADLQFLPHPNAPIINPQDPNTQIFAFQLPFHQHIYTLNPRRSLRIWCLLQLLTLQAANALQLLWRFAGISEYLETSVFFVAILLAQVLITNYRVPSGPYVVLQYVVELVVDGFVGITFLSWTNDAVKHFTGMSLSA